MLCRFLLGNKTEIKEKQKSEKRKQKLHKICRKRVLKRNFTCAIMVLSKLYIVERGANLKDRL